MAKFEADLTEAQMDVYNYLVENYTEFSFTRQLHNIAAYLAYAEHPASSPRAANTESFPVCATTRMASVRRVRHPHPCEEDAHAPMGSKSPAFKGRGSPLTRDLCTFGFTSHELSKYIPRSRATISRALEKLLDSGFLSTQDRTNPAGGVPVIMHFVQLLPPEEIFADLPPADAKKDSCDQRE